MAGAAAVTLFLLANGFGTFMWARRGRIRPYPAIQTLIVVAGAASLAATWVLDTRGHFESLGIGAQVSAPSMYVALTLMIPGLLFLFRVIERDNQAADK